MTLDDQYSRSDDGSPLTRTHTGAAIQYLQVSQQCAGVVIRRYSTSFSLASRLLDPLTRPHVANIYALARIGDEIVDGALTGAVSQENTSSTAPTAQQSAEELLEHLRCDTIRATKLGYSANPLVHAFAATARKFGIGADLINPFFDSMSVDLTVRTHTAQSLERYIYGSAEVIGEMCLRTFSGGGLGEDPAMAAGARALGAAFQKVNFLRDVREDYFDLGRNYLPGFDPAALTHSDITVLCDDIDCDLALARGSMLGIPGRDQRAVRAAHDLFAELNDHLRSAGPAAVLAGRTSVPTARKLWLLVRTAGPRARARNSSLEGNPT